VNLFSSITVAAKASRLMAVAVVIVDGSGSGGNV